MQLHELKPPEGARRRSQRVGRGTGSGRGKTAGRGQKGQGARSEGFRLGFEGGQMPLSQRLPKLGGFKNPFAKRYRVVNLTKLNRFKDGMSVDLTAFYEAGLAEPGESVKVLGTGKLRRRLSVTAHAASESARTAIEGRGGSVTLINGEPAPATRRTERAGKRQREGTAEPRAGASVKSAAGTKARGPGEREPEE